MNGWFGPWELLIVLGIVLLIFGPKRLPALGRSLGHGARSFRDAVRGRFDRSDDEDEVEHVEEPAQLPPAAMSVPSREKESSREKEPV